MTTGTTRYAISRISAVNVTIDYDLVFDCSAQVISGVGIISATPSLAEVVEGESCTFSATVEQYWKFDGWYDNPNFTGTKLSSSATYVKSNITKNTTLYPKALPSYNINVYGDTSKFTYKVLGTISETNRAYEGDTITIQVTTSKDIYKFSGAFESDTHGNKTSNLLSNDNPYVFSMPANELNIYVEIGKVIMIYVDCENCSISGKTSPISSSAGKVETLNFSYDSSKYDFSGIYSDSKHSNRLSSTSQYSFTVGDNDIYLYAKAISKQQIYIKENGTWVAYSEVYVKENGIW